MGRRSRQAANAKAASARAAEARAARIEAQTREIENACVAGRDGESEGTRDGVESRDCEFSPSESGDSDEDSDDGVCCCEPGVRCEACLDDGECDCQEEGCEECMEVEGKSNAAQAACDRLFDPAQWSSIPQPASKGSGWPAWLQRECPDAGSESTARRTVARRGSLVSAASHSRSLPMFERQTSAQGGRKRKHVETIDLTADSDAGAGAETEVIVSGGSASEGEKEIEEETDLLCAEEGLEQNLRLRPREPSRADGKGMYARFPPCVGA
jgi:hypothetical protein